MFSYLDDEYINIYVSNVSSFYVIAWIFTTVVLLSTLWIPRGNHTLLFRDAMKESFASHDSLLIKKSDAHVETKDGVRETTGDLEFPNHSPEFGGALPKRKTPTFLADQNLMRRYKAARQQAIEELLTAGLSSDQLAREQEVEKAQLDAIFNLLKQQEDQFKIESMDELKEQMKQLYRAQD